MRLTITSLFLTLSSIIVSGEDTNRVLDERERNHGEKDVGNARNKGWTTEYDQDATPEVIFSSGVSNGAFTCATNEKSGLELCLRGKLRFPNPQNIFNSQGDGTYNFTKGVPNGTMFPAAEWSVEWTVNSDVACDTIPCDKPLNKYDYEIGLDGDRSFKASYLSWDPINQYCASNAMGTNATANGNGTELDCTTFPLDDYQDNVGNYSVAQNSWSYSFFPAGNLLVFNPEISGVYTVYLKASTKPSGWWKGKTVAYTKINFLVSMPEEEVDCENGDWDTTYNQDTGTTIPASFVQPDLFRSEQDCKNFINRRSQYKWL